MFWFLPIILWSGLAGVATSLVLSIFLDEDTLCEEISRKVPNAFKALILKKNQNAIDVGIFKKNEDRYSSTMEIRAEKGISSSIHVGQIIYM